MTITIGVLALQGAFYEHLVLLRKAANYIKEQSKHAQGNELFAFIEVRNEKQLILCDGLIIPGGESTTISFVAAQSNLLEALRQFVKTDRKPTWGTCAGLILLAEAANATKKGGQELIGGLDVRVNRNHFGRQVESFQADLNLPFLVSPHSPDIPFPGIFIRAPIVEKILPNVTGEQSREQSISDIVVAPSRRARYDVAEAVLTSHVEIMASLPGRLEKAAEGGVDVQAEPETGDIVAVRQGNVFGTSFHPELTSDIRIHVWWLREVAKVFGSSKMPA